MTKTILVIDQDPSVTSFLTTILGEEGFPVTSVSSPTEAQRLYAGGKFDLIITEAFGQDRAFEFDPAFVADLQSMFPETPIILYSTYGDLGVVRAGQFGLMGVVPKPFFDLDQLFLKVHELLGTTEPALAENPVPEAGKWSAA